MLGGAKVLSEVAGEGAGAVTVPDGASPHTLALVAGAGGGGHATVPPLGPGHGAAPL